MTADSALDKTASATTGALKKVGGFFANRANPFKASGLWLTAALGLTLVGGTWLFAPKLMAMATGGAPVITQGASVGSNAMSMLTYSGNSALQAGSIALEKAGSIVTTANWSGVGEGFQQVGSSLTSGGAEAVDVVSNASGSMTELTNTLPQFAPAY